MMDGLSGTSSLEQVLDGAFSLLATVGNVMEVGGVFLRLFELIYVMCLNDSKLML